MPSVALATCAAFPDLYEDDQPVIPALAARGVDASPAVWNDPGVDWAAYDLVVIRNTWDYIDHFDEFVAWVRSVPRLANPADVILWNTDKHYLADVAATGVPVVPTTYVTPGAAPPELPSGEVVVKPSISVGSRDTLRSRDPAQIQAQIETILGSGRTAMVQPYLDAVDENGETAIIFLGGEHSHACRKGPQLTPDRAFTEGVYAGETMSARQATAAELEVARAAMAAVPGGRDGLLYARIDVIPDASGQPVVLEIEITEPSLFLELGDDAVDRCADAIAAAVSGARS
jgi:glutathione synthase/RimK-type ligase-like ATP-grasp enzyme